VVGRAFEDLLNLDDEANRVGRAPPDFMVHIEGTIIPEYFWYINSEEMAGGLPPGVPSLIFFSLILKLLLFFECFERKDSWGALAICLCTICLELVVNALATFYLTHASELSPSLRDAVFFFALYIAPLVVILLHVLLAMIMAAARRLEAAREIEAQVIEDEKED